MNLKLDANVGDIVAMIGGYASQLAHFCATAPAQIPPEELQRHVARMYFMTEQIKAMADSARAEAEKANGHAEANGAAPN